MDHGDVRDPAVGTADRRDGRAAGRGWSPRLEDQYANADAIDTALGEWIERPALAECLTRMEACGVTASPIYDVADIIADPIYQELGDVISVEDDDLGPVRMQGVIPRFANHPGSVWRTGRRWARTTSTCCRTCSDSTTNVSRRCGSPA